MEPSTLIRRARQAAGMTQTELAKRARMKQPEIARLEARGANPTLSTLKRVVAATGHGLKLELDEDFGLDETLIEVLVDRKSTRLNSSHIQKSRMPASA